MSFWCEDFGWLHSLWIDGLLQQQATIFPYQRHTAWQVSSPSNQQNFTQGKINKNENIPLLVLIGEQVSKEQ